MASFEAKIGWKRSRKRKNKNYRSAPFLPAPLKNTIMASFQAKNRLEKEGKEIK